MLLEKRRLTTQQIHGNAESVRTLFKQAGVEPMWTHTECGKMLFGYYPCNAPPRTGLQFDGKNFDFESEALRWKEVSANNCSILITGSPDAAANSWLVGQAWMQGKYIDHDAEGMTIAFANLKDPVNA